MNSCHLVFDIDLSLIFILFCNYDESTYLWSVNWYEWIYLHQAIVINEDFLFHRQHFSWFMYLGAVPFCPKKNSPVAQINCGQYSLINSLVINCSCIALKTKVENEFTAAMIMIILRRIWCDKILSFGKWECFCKLIQITGFSRHSKSFIKLSLLSINFFVK